MSQRSRKTVQVQECKAFDVLIRIKGTSRFPIFAKNRKEAQRELEKMQDPRFDGYNCFWNCVYDAIEYTSTLLPKLRARRRSQSRRAPRFHADAQNR